MNIQNFLSMTMRGLMLPGLVLSVPLVFQLTVNEASATIVAIAAPTELKCKKNCKKRLSCVGWRFNANIKGRKCFLTLSKKKGFHGATHALRGMRK